MDRIWNSAFALLLVTGALLGLTLPFGKIAAQSGVPPLLWTFIFSFGAAFVLCLALIAAPPPVHLDAAHAALLSHHRRHFLRRCRIS